MAYESDFKEPRDVLRPEDFTPEEGVDYGYVKTDDDGNVIETEGSPEKDPTLDVKENDNE